MNYILVIDLIINKQAVLGYGDSKQNLLIRAICSQRQTNEFFKEK